VLARLRAAEEEAARLRKQLEIAQNAKGAPAAPEVIEKPKRIDSTDSRETLSGLVGKAPQRTAWLSEADVEFFVGSSVGETGQEVPAVDPEAQATIQRRLLIGGLLAAGAAAFALVPTEALRPLPPRPLFFYVVPLLRVSDLLADAQPIIEDGDWGQLRVLLSRVQGTPNNVRDNLDAVVSWLGDAREGSRDKQSRAQALSAELIEYLDAMDYNKYFDAMPTATVTGAKAAEFVKFSGAARKAAATKLAELLSLVSPATMETARAQATLY